MDLSLGLRALRWLLPLLLTVPNASIALADENCEQWSKLAPELRSRGIEKSFTDQASWGANANLDGCLRDSAARMASEIETGCQGGGALEAVWQQAGYAWVLTCSVVASRVQGGVPTGESIRLEIRSAWQQCTAEGTDLPGCQQRLIQRYSRDFAREGSKTECQGFLDLPRESRLAEVEDRVRSRFSTTPDVARCMSTSASAIETEVGSLCRRGVKAQDAWSQVLGTYTDRCLQRDSGF